MPRRPKYCQEIADAICESVRNGATYTDAAQAAGVDPSTLRRWRERYTAFCAALTRAESECACRMAKALTQFAGEDWRAAESWLKRRRREEWGENQVVTLLQKAAAEVQALGDQELLAILRGDGEDPEATG